MSTATLNPDRDRVLAGVSDLFFGIRPTLRPPGATQIIAHSEPEEVDDETTSGLEDIVDWDELEERLFAGEFPSKQVFRRVVIEMFAQVDVVPSRYILEVVVPDGICNLPLDTAFTFENVHQWRAIQARRIHDALPNGGTTSVRQVKEIRRRAAEGEPYFQIAKAMDLSHRVVSDIARGKTFKDVA